MRYGVCFLITHQSSFELPYLFTDNDYTWVCFTSPASLPFYLENPCVPIWDAELFTRGAISLHVESAIRVAVELYTLNEISSFPPSIEVRVLRYSDLSVSSLTMIRNLTSNCGRARYGPEIWRS